VASGKKLFHQAVWPARGSVTSVCFTVLRGDVWDITRTIKDGRSLSDSSLGVNAVLDECHESYQRARAKGITLYAWNLAPTTTTYRLASQVLEHVGVLPWAISLKAYQSQKLGPSVMAYMTMPLGVSYVPVEFRDPGGTDRSIRIALSFVDGSQPKFQCRNPPVRIEVTEPIAQREVKAAEKKFRERRSRRVQPEDDGEDDGVHVQVVTPEPFSPPGEGLSNSPGPAVMLRLPLSPTSWTSTSTETLSPASPVVRTTSSPFSLFDLMAEAREQVEQREVVVDSSQKVASIDRELCELYARVRWLQHERASLFNRS
jgi:hypothetical protein